MAAAIPLEKSAASSAPSSAASFFSAARTVGFPYRPYSSRSISPLKYRSISAVSANAYVADQTMGVVTESWALLRGSPPRTASVPGFGSLELILATAGNLPAHHDG